jgi:hypothetical protein
LFGSGGAPAQAKPGSLFGAPSKKPDEKKEATGGASSLFGASKTDSAGTSSLFGQNETKTDTAAQNPKPDLAKTKSSLPSDTVGTSPFNPLVGASQAPTDANKLVLSKQNSGTSGASGNPFLTKENSVSNPFVMATINSA